MSGHSFLQKVKQILGGLRRWERRSSVKITEKQVHATVFFEEGEFEGRRCHLPRVNYLEFIQLRRTESRAELDKVMRIVAEASEPEKQIAVLLDVRNWRPHLIGCVAALYAQDRVTVVEALWQAFDRASWASAQLAASLSLIDSGFVHQALLRLRSEVPVHGPLNVVDKTHKAHRLENSEGWLALWGLLTEVFRQESLKSAELLALKERMRLIARKPSSDQLAVSWREEALVLLQAQKKDAGDRCEDAEPGQR